MSPNSTGSAESTGSAPIALVTGASKGIGASCARDLVNAGYRVALLARGKEGLSSLAATIGGTTLVLPTDVTSVADIDAAFTAIHTEWGGAPSVIIHAAGAGDSAPLVDTTDESWQRMLDLNLTAPFVLMRRALPAMTAAGFGRIVVIASVVAKRGESRIPAYTASKHGVLGLVRAASAEVARTGVTVNAICPGYVDTPMTASTIADIAQRTGKTLDEAEQILARRQPIGRLISPDEVAEAAMLCVSNGAINGQGINVDGGAVQS